jgi:carbamoyl-phosphate synthase large subunit
MSAKIGIGYNLSELVNKITKSTTACFEPSLDYIVCKHPRWDFSKFELVNRKLGPTMKSVGEVMAVGRTFEESFHFSEEELENKLSHPDDQILYNVAAAIKAGFSAERINNLSAIDPWFIEKIKNIIKIEEKITKEDLGKSLLWEAKKMGFSDKQIGRAKGKTPDEIRHLRKESGVLPSVKQIDSLAAEWPAVTNYLYLTYGGNSHDVKINPDEKGIVVLGAGPYRIGSSVEFDWGTVNMVWGLQENGEKNISVVNCNPETVSTDYDICTRLYFEELTQERILDITEFEHPKGVITCVGGQTANNLTPGLAEHGVNILGTSAHDVDRAEDRSKFSAELDKLHIQQPRWQAFSNLSEAKSFAQEVGFPVIVRPSYVLSGAAMKVVWSQEELKTYVKEATDVSPDHPVVISKFMLDSLEVDVDGISNGKEVIIGAIVEHIDSAGVHSGDAMMCIPPWRLNNKTIETITEYTTKIATTFNVKGPFNLQFLVHDNHVYVIELNIRASRSMPFVSKLVKTNLISLASKAILDKPLPDIPKNKWQKIHNYGIKVPQFSFMQLEGADIALGVEMQSTGEAACFGSSFYDALAKGLTSVGYNLPQTGAALVTVGGAQNKEKLLQSIASLKNLGFKIFATEHTAEFFEEKIGEIEVVHKISEPDRKPNIADLLYDRKINFIINIPSTSTLEKYVGMLDDEYQIRRKSLELGVPVLTTIELADSFVKTLEWLKTNKTTIEPIEPYDPF